MSTEELTLCYNRGCGQRFDPQNNSEDSCVHHPGAPFFHDAYKGWSCCNKKCTDFTEFLNIKGCTRSLHNGTKPAEPEKPKKEANPEEVIEYRAPEPPKPVETQRPSFETPLVKVVSSLSPSLQQELQKRQNKTGTQENVEEAKLVNGIKVGTTCKHGGCKETYSGQESEGTSCTYHPGVPIFHEGLKFWTCCQRRTTDFQAFLNQEGCTSGEHQWLDENDGKASKIVQCRYDWMQTGSHITVNIYAKNYDPANSFVEVNPIRLRPYISFPENEAVFQFDLELRGVIAPTQSSVLYTPTKVEIKLKKDGPMTWNCLEIPRPVQVAPQEAAKAPVEDSDLPRVETVDLSDL